MLKVFDVLIDLLVFIEVCGEIARRLDQRHAIYCSNHRNASNPIDPLSLVFYRIVQEVQKRDEPSHIKMVEVSLFRWTHITVNDRNEYNRKHKYRENTQRTHNTKLD